MDIKTSQRNGPVVGIVPVTDDDELLMMTARGKIQRIAASDINIIGRNTQGVRIMKLDEEDTLSAIVKVPKEDVEVEVLEIQSSATGIAPESTTTSNLVPKDEDNSSFDDPDAATESSDE
jgi:DNA gyrase subunit A